MKTVLLTVNKMLPRCEPMSSTKMYIVFLSYNAYYSSKIDDIDPLPLTCHKFFM